MTFGAEFADMGIEVVLEFVRLVDVVFVDSEN
jgi:hypothetical protein